MAETGPTSYDGFLSYSHAADDLLAPRLQARLQRFAKPEAAESEWVNREIDYWTEHKDPDRILPVLTDGEFGWADGDRIRSRKLRR